MNAALLSNRSRFIVALSCALFVFVGFASGQNVDAARARVLRADLEADVRYLASDELQGRRTGKPEAVVAAKWLAAQLEKSGVAPAGDGGTFLQRVPMSELERKRDVQWTVTLKSGEKLELANGVDLDQTRNLSRDLRIERVVVVSKVEDLPAAPATSIALVLPESKTARTELLAHAGTPEGRGWGLLLALGPDTAGKPRDFSPSKAPLSIDNDDAPSARLRGLWKARFLAGEVASLAVTANAVRIPVEAYNVVGVVRGSGEQAREAVVVSAHYDHLGVDSKPPPAATPPTGEVDVIYNGADDDASGCAVVLELADALVHAGGAERTVVFFFAVGEEVGLLGTDWYMDHPFVPLADTVLNLNFEMLGRPDAKAGGAGRMWLTGDERSNLGPAFREKGLAILADPHPDEHFFERSDNMAFVLRGIVGQSLSTYDLHKDYHHTSDEADTLDYAHMETCARNGFDALLLVASSAFTPRWNPDQKFRR
ncbi:MAG: M28 family peptidase [Planctomycetes bacterium]|nr:M28 family peptidase [Planctomycetota bacterium]